MADNTTYILPRDAPEEERLNFQHALLTKTFGGLYRAPLDPSHVRRVLDIGCGTGNWAIDYAKQNPNAQVIGFDVTGSPEWNTAPPNCTLIEANGEDDSAWVSFGDKFDYIHARLIVVSIRNWPSLFEKISNHLTSGGWCEIQDLQFPTHCLNGSTSAESKVVAWGHLMSSGMRKFGLDPNAINHFPQQMQHVGLVNAKTDEFKMMSGPWADTEHDRELGQMGNKNFHMGFRGFTTTVMKGAHGFSDEQVEDQVRGVLEEIDTLKFRTYVPLKVVYAQKS
ncbi:Hypothetical protein R9X50_00690600 [Acrodontium crateriforme]|uniref:S-adenosyl-L-methionine-dependent methyltransferase n=1 Tax=Acrodontium crateriforme TaxID=150365 RepID=A0AAQ3MDL6_9PEZI|nr:Hypothetical protein R9X50_00690600 [Acrodontium crateriforme]